MVKNSDIYSILSNLSSSMLSISVCTYLPYLTLHPPSLQDTCINSWNGCYTCIPLYFLLSTSSNAINWGKEYLGVRVVWGLKIMYSKYQIHGINTWQLLHIFELQKRHEREQKRSWEVEGTHSELNVCLMWTSIIASRRHNRNMSAQINFAARKEKWQVQATSNPEALCSR